MRISVLIRAYIAVVVVAGFCGCGSQSGGGVPPPPSHNDFLLSHLEISLIPQSKLNWCWAACSEMAMLALGHEDRSQCWIAIDEKGGDLLKESPIYCSEFDRPNFGPSHRVLCISVTQIPFQEIRKELDTLKHPFLIARSYSYPGPKNTLYLGGHMYAVIGDSIIDNDTLIELWNPLPINKGETETWFLSELRRRPSDAWTQTFYRIQ